MILDIFIWIVMGAIFGWLFYRTWHEKLIGKNILCILVGIISTVLGGFMIDLVSVDSPFHGVVNPWGLMILFIITSILVVTWLLRNRHYWSKIQERLDAITCKWWFFSMVCLLFFLPAYSWQHYDMEQTPELITEVLSNSLVYTFPALFPLFKTLPLLLLIGLIFFGERVTRFFNVYVAVTLSVFAILQNMAFTEVYGFAIITGNLVVYLLVASFWWWESMFKQNDFSPIRRSFWRYWVVPFAVLAFWFPVNTETMSPDFNPWLLLTNEAGLAGCMMIPVFLTVLTLFYPKVNLAVMRITAFAGLITSLFNCLQWFIFQPQAWYMGFLHMPLLLISVYALTLSLKKINKHQETRGRQDIGLSGTGSGKYELKT
jgi:hypothetical protein